MHRDIKFDNIMVNFKNETKNSEHIDITDFEFKIGDMGLAKKLRFKN